VACANVSKRTGHGGGRSVRGAAGGDRQPCVCQGADGRAPTLADAYAAQNFRAPAARAQRMRLNERRSGVISRL
jgi:hypothetical protein